MSIRNDVIEILWHCYRKNGCQSVHQGEVFRVFLLKKYVVSPETVPRMLRKLREEGYVIGSDGYYIPVISNKIPNLLQVEVGIPTTSRNKSIKDLL